MPLDAVAIGERIRKLRKESQKSQEEFAEMIDTSSRTISNLENGVVIPTAQTLANIAISCNITVDEIMGLKK